MLIFTVYFVLEIQYTITVDPIPSPRVKFMASKSNKYTFIVKSGAKQKCEDEMRVYLVFMQVS